MRDLQASVVRRIVVRGTVVDENSDDQGFYAVIETDDLTQTDDLVGAARRVDETCRELAWWTKPVAPPDELTAPARDALRRLRLMLGTVAVVAALLLGGCTTENEETVTPNRVCTGHSGVKSLGAEWSRDNIGPNGNQPNYYTAVVCRDGFLGTAVNWKT